MKKLDDLEYKVYEYIDQMYGDSVELSCERLNGALKFKLIAQPYCVTFYVSTDTDFYRIIPSLYVYGPVRVKPEYNELLSNEAKLWYDSTRIPSVLGSLYYV